MRKIQAGTGDRASSAGNASTRHLRGGWHPAWRSSSRCRSIILTVSREWHGECVRLPRVDVAWNDGCCTNEADAKAAQEHGSRCAPKVFLAECHLRPRDIRGSLHSSCGAAEARKWTSPVCHRLSRFLRFLRATHACELLTRAAEGRAVFACFSLNLVWTCLNRQRTFRSCRCVHKSHCSLV